MALTKVLVSLLFRPMESYDRSIRCFLVKHFTIRIEVCRNTIVYFKKRFHL